MFRNLLRIMRGFYFKNRGIIRAAIILSIIIIALWITLDYSNNFRAHALENGSAAGENIGRLVGKVSGSYSGMLQWRECYQDGRRAAENAEDTVVRFTNEMKNVGNLEVLCASGTYTDMVQITNGGRTDYAALLSQKYNAIFTVDLINSQCINMEDGLHIILEQPVVEFIPVGEPKKMSEFVRALNNGSAKKGYEDANAALYKMADEATKELQGNESLMQSARISAEDQIKQLCNAVSLEDKNIFVEFKGGMGND